MLRYRVNYRAGKRMIIFATDASVSLVPWFFYFLFDKSTSETLALFGDDEKSK